MKNNNKIDIIKSHLSAVIDYVVPLLPEDPVIIEAGAFIGTGTVIMSVRWPRAQIHAFEPVPAIYERLCSATAGHKNITCHRAALSDIDGQMQFYVAEKPKKPGIVCPAGSLLKPKERLAWSPIVYPSIIDVPTIRLDTWARQVSYGDRVDFLWLDLQGYTLPVLQAALSILKSVKVIYTEVEFIEAYENQYLFDEVKAWLSQHGFTMVAGDFVDQKNWFFGNAIFINNNHFDS